MSVAASENNGIHYTVSKVPLPTNKGFVFMGVVGAENWGLFEDLRTGTAVPGLIYPKQIAK